MCAANDSSSLGPWRSRRRLRPWPRLPPDSRPGAVQHPASGKCGSATPIHSRQSRSLAELRAADLNTPRVNVAGSGVARSGTTLAVSLSALPFFTRTRACNSDDAALTSLVFRYTPGEAASSRSIRRAGTTTRCTSRYRPSPPGHHRSRADPLPGRHRQRTASPRAAWCRCARWAARGAERRCRSHLRSARASGSGAPSPLPVAVAPPSRPSPSALVRGLGPGSWARPWQGLRACCSYRRPTRLPMWPPRSILVGSSAWRCAVIAPLDPRHKLAARSREAAVQTRCSAAVAHTLEL